MFRRLRTLCIVPAALLTLALASCNTPASRIRKHADLYAKLAPDVQERIAKGAIRIGDTPDVVFLAAGKPDRVRKRVSAAGNVEEWVWLAADWTSTEPPWSSDWTTSGRRPSRDWYWRPQPRGPYGWHAVLRVVFENGLVTAMETTEPPASTPIGSGGAASDDKPRQHSAP